MNTITRIGMTTIVPRSAHLDTTIDKTRGGNLFPPLVVLSVKHIGAIYLVSCACQSISAFISSATCR